MSISKKLFPKHYNYCGSILLFFEKAYNFIINRTITLLKSLRLNFISKIHYHFFPYPHNPEDTFCFAAACKKDWNLLRLIKLVAKTDSITVVTEDNVDCRNRFQIISYDEIPAYSFRTVVIPSKEAESLIEAKCRLVYEKYKYDFSLWDPHNYFLTSKLYFSGISEGGLNKYKYRDFELFVSPGNIILPSYFANWGYINYLLSEIVQDGMSVLDMWAGSGCIGFSLKKDKEIDISFSDINYFALLSIKKTMANYQNLDGKAWLSDVFSNIPATEKYDLIVGNPPCGRDSFKDFISVGGADNEWQSHMSFFLKAPKYLKQGGKICIVEKICNNKAHTNDFAAAFYKDFNNQFSELRLTEIRPLLGTFLSTVLIEKC